MLMVFRSRQEKLTSEARTWIWLSSSRWRDFSCIVAVPVDHADSGEPVDPITITVTPRIVVCACSFLISGGLRSASGAGPALCWFSQNFVDTCSIAISEEISEPAPASCVLHQTFQDTSNVFSPLFWIHADPNSYGRRAQAFERCILRNSLLVMFE